MYVSSARQPRDVAGVVVLLFLQDVLAGQRGVEVRLGLLPVGLVTDDVQHAGADLDGGAPDALHRLRVSPGEGRVAIRAVEREEDDRRREHWPLAVVGARHDHQASRTQRTTSRSPPMHTQPTE